MQKTTALQDLRRLKLTLRLDNATRLSDYYHANALRAKAALDEYETEQSHVPEVHP